MVQVLTVKVKLLPTKEVEKILEEMGKEYISVVNGLVHEMVDEKKVTKKTSKHVQANIPSVLKSQAIRDASSIFLKKVKKSDYKIIPILKRPICIWNNQNFTFNSTHIHVPIFIDGKVRRVPIRALLEDKDGRSLKILQNKLGALRINKKSNKWIAQIAVTILPVEKSELKIMGVDLGLKVPAVAVTCDMKVRFCGNGRQNKYMKRKFQTQRKMLAKKKKLNALRNISDKEQRWMKDQDHKISRKIINFARDNNVSVIRLEKLANIRQTARKSRKNDKSLHTWSFYRLSRFIEYKANLEGIRVEYVNPAYTSQTCPVCAVKNKVKNRKYICGCGYRTHRDIVGAMNIRYAPVIDGKSQSA